jgi:hypothetical protein
MSTVDVQERWVRWGHKRKPNKAVLKLYSIFDTLGDFKPMFLVFFRWIGRNAMAIWEFLGSSAMILVNLGMMAGIIYLSVNHSHEMLIYAGFSGIGAWVAVAVFETSFVYCSQVIQNSFKKGKKQSFWAWTGFLIGFAFVVVSNYMGMAENRIGKTIGVSMPCLLLVMKGVLAYQFKKEDQIKKKKTRWWHRLFFWRKKDNEVLENTSTTSKKIASEKNTSSSDPTGEKTPAQNITSSPEKSPVEITTSGKITSDKKSPAKNVASSKKRNTTTSTRNTTSKKKTSGKVVDITKKSDEKVMELALIALQIKNDEGECGRPRLIKHTGCTDHYAKKAIKLMEELEEKGVTPEELSPTGEITSDKKSPATGEKTPPADNLASEEESPAPATGEKTPPADNLASEEESPAPATGEKTPPADNLTSEEESPAPANEESPAPAPTSVKLVTQ